MKRRATLGRRVLVNPGPNRPLSDGDQAGFIPMEDVGFGGVVTTERTLAVGEADGFTPFLDGDVVVAKITPSFENGKGGIASDLPGGLAFGTTELLVFRPISIEGRYLMWWMHSDLVRRRGATEMRGAAGQQRVQVQYFKRLLVPIDDRPNQVRVANFLDRETARIDELVTKKEKLSDRLEEYRWASVFRWATRGVDNTSELVDAGVEWIGEVPSHWRTAMVKYLAAPGTGHTPSRSHPEYWEDCTIPWFTLADVWQLRNERRRIVDGTAEMVSELGIAHSSAEKHPAGTVILSRTASVGFPAILGREMAVSQDFMTWTPGPLITSEYLLLVLYAMRDELRRLTMGSTHQTIYMPDLHRLVGPVPPRDEQDRIVSRAFDELDRVDQAQGRIREQVTLLREFRQALITAAVTGRLDEATLKGDKPVEEAMEMELPA